MQSSHDTLVAALVPALRALGDVSSDLAGGNPFRLPQSAELVLSAFVPTRAVFATFPAMSASDLSWKVPDIVVTREDRRLVIDVCGWRESTARTARKVENTIASSRSAKIVGVVLVHEPPARKGFTRSAKRDAGLDLAMDHLTRSLATLRGAPVNVESPVDTLKGIWETFAPRGLGRVRWGAIREVVAARGSSGSAWISEVTGIADELLRSDAPLLGMSPPSPEF